MATTKQINDAYELLAKAESEAIRSVRDKTQELMEAMNSALEGFPLGRQPQSPGISNLTSWRSTVQMMISGMDSLTSQYAYEDPADADKNA